jgi:hypothetical protein
MDVILEMNDTFESLRLQQPSELNIALLTKAVDTVSLNIKSWNILSEI